MDRRQLTIMANKFQSVFDPSTLNDQGDQLEFCQRQRLITPYRFGLSVVASMASQQVQSIADLQRDFNALWDLEVSYKAFYNQLAKPSCSAFLRTSLCDIMGYPLKAGHSIVSNTYRQSLVALTRSWHVIDL